MKSPSPCKCHGCREFFVPAPNNRAIQCYCTEPECRKASKAAAQAKWLSKPENASYFRGAENVERVRQWRRKHPGRRRGKRSQEQDGLQDFDPVQVVQPELVIILEKPVSTGDSGEDSLSKALNCRWLQDFVDVQVPLLAGVISMIHGDGLQDSFEGFARQLVERGQRVLETERLRPFGGTSVKTPTEKTHQC